jgi:hypothetical protein
MRIGAINTDANLCLTCPSSRVLQMLEDRFGGWEEELGREKDGLLLDLPQFYGSIHAVPPSFYEKLG